MSRLPATVGLLALLLVAAVLPLPAVARASNDPANLASAPARIGTAPLAANNSSIHQENPDDVQSNDDMSGLERWLAGRLSSRLGGSTVKIEQGQYKDAHSVLGDRYDDLLSKYVEVSGKTKGTQDDETAKSLQDAQRSQQEYVSRVQRYRRLHERYQRAKQNGNDKKARRLAHQLERLQQEIGQSSDELTTSYGNLSKNTNVSTANETRRVQNVTQNISEQQASVRQSEFVKTNLTASIEKRRVSFLDPIHVTGRLTDENGTAIDNQSIRLQLGDNRTARVRTDANGSFSLIGRPAVTSLGAQSFTVEYRTNNSSVYLGSKQTVRARVSQVTSRISISSHTHRARYNHTVNVSGRVHVRNRSGTNLVTSDLPAADVPVAVFIGKIRVGTTRTAPNGTFSFTASMPAGVPAGTRRIYVSYPFHDRALTASNGTTLVTIPPTPTTLTLSGTTGKTRQADLTGRLHTVGGASVTNQRVSIFANGTKVASTRTGANGTYRVSLVLPSSAVSADGNTSFVARFDGHGKNVESARASTTLAVVSGDAGPLNGETRGWLVSFGVAALITLSGFFVWRSDIGGGSDDGDGAVTPAVTTTASESEGTGGRSSTAAVAFLDRARSARDAGEFETAVEMGYAAARDRFNTAVPSTTSTHWEFYNACRETDLGGDTISVLGTLTERYEEAAFAANRVSQETATAVIDAVSSLVEDEHTSE